MNETPFALTTLFTVGPVAVTTTVVVTWAIMAALTLAGYLISRRLSVRDPSAVQAVAELVVEAVSAQIHDIVRSDARPFLPLIGTLFVFILAANWSALVPGIEPPTAHLETDGALAGIVFVATIWFGIRRNGLGGYLKTFAQPSFVMIPLNLVGTITRTFALMVRLFGNVMGGLFVISIILSLAGLLVPIPLMALDLLVGAIQAYIFAVLAAVFIGGGVGEGGRIEPQERTE
jgi:F-type H+-transporting ATPase subunit a